MSSFLIEKILGVFSHDVAGRKIDRVESENRVLTQILTQALKLEFVSSTLSLGSWQTTDQAAPLSTHPRVLLGSAVQVLTCMEERTPPSQQCYFLKSYNLRS